jgi:hypothetical protein
VADRLAGVLGYPLRLGKLARADEHLRELPLRLDEESVLLRPAEPSHRVAQHLFGALDVAAPKLERTEHGRGPPRTPRGSGFLECDERLAQLHLRQVQVLRLCSAAAGNRPGQPECLAASGLFGERCRTARQLECLLEIPVDARDSRELRQSEALEVAPPHRLGECDRRLAVTPRRLAVTDPPGDRREQRPRVVEAVQLVLRQNMECLVSQRARGRDVAVGVERDLGE